MINGERSKKIMRDKRYKIKLKNLHSQNTYCVKLYEPDNERDGITIKKPHYRRKYFRKHNGRKSMKRYCKNVSSRIIRRSKYNDIPLRGNGYKKKYDLNFVLY